MPRNTINMARTNAGRRREVQKFPNVLSFPGTNTVYMTIGTDAYKFERTQPFTIGFWINPVDYAASAGRHIFAEFKTSGTFRGWLCRIDASGTLRFWLINTFSTNELKGNYAPPPIGTLTWVCISYDGSSTAAGIKCWYNHVLQTQTSSTATLTGTIVDSGAVVSTFGGWAGNLNAWKGLLGEAFIDARQWTQTEVDDYWYDKKFSLGTPTDLWSMTEGSGTSVASTGIGAHNGTLNASVTWSAAYTPMRSRTSVPQNRLTVS